MKKLFALALAALMAFSVVAIAAEEDIMLISEEEGVALGHNIVTDTTPANCVYAGSTKTYCDICYTVFSEKVLPVTEHNSMNI